MISHFRPNVKATAKASADDAAFFVANPKRSYRIRPPYPKEFPPLAAEGVPCAVSVQISPGVRVRGYCHITGYQGSVVDLDSEEFARWVWEGIQNAGTLEYQSSPSKGLH